MKKKNKNFGWKISTLILTIIFLSLLILSFNNELKKKDNLVELKYSEKNQEKSFFIPKDNLESFMSLIDYGELIKICNLELNECILIEKREVLNE